MSDNTFYSPTGDNIRIENGASNVEILNSILWARDGYDIYVANDSQTGFFSDYNSLFASDSGILVYWTQNFTDILDWQDDVALYDLHSVGTTVVIRPTACRISSTRPTTTSSFCRWSAARPASDAALEQGSPIVEYDTPVAERQPADEPGLRERPDRLDHRPRERWRAWHLAGRAPMTAAVISSPDRAPRPASPNSRSTCCRRAIARHRSTAARSACRSAAILGRSPRPRRTPGRSPSRSSTAPAPRCQRR